MSKKSDPSNFINVADFLLRNSRTRNDPIYVRTAIGRAYYASLMSTFEKLQSIGISIRNDENIHREVIDSLMKKDSFSGNLLDKLREERVKADYIMYGDFKLGRGNRCYKFAQLILDKIKNIK